MRSGVLRPAVNETDVKFYFTQRKHVENSLFIRALKFLRPAQG